MLVRRTTTIATIGVAGVMALCALAIAPTQASGHRPGATHRPTRAASRGQAKARAHAGPIADFNKDSFGDLVIGVPGEGIGNISNAGGVNVLYGSKDGLTATNNQFISQASSGVVGSATEDAHFGQAVAVGDLNKDGFTDLAVGSPGSKVNGLEGAGSVEVLYGAQRGLDLDSSQFFTQATGGVPGNAAAGNGFGSGLAIGDFDHDGVRDLAIGIPNATVDGVSHAGAVDVLRGTTDGIRLASDEAIINGVEKNSGFGSALAAASFDGSAGTDLAIGAPFANGTGSAYWASGRAHGFSAPTEVPTDAHSSDALCGISLAAGNIDGGKDGTADLAIGCPLALTGPGTGAGGWVEVHSATPVHGLGTTKLRTASPEGQDEAHYGQSVAVADLGDFEGAARDEIMIGEPLFDTTHLSSVGTSFIMHTELGSIFQDEFNQGTQEIFGDREAGDIFGEAVATGDFDGDGGTDAVFGVPGESLGNLGGAGGINVIYGDSGGLHIFENQFFSQASKGVHGTAEREDFFGDALAGRTD